MASYLGRRKFLATLGGAATWPLAASAQYETKIPRIGIIDDSPRWNAFRHGLRDLGYLEGQNIAFDYAYGDGVPERLAEAAAVLVRRLLQPSARPRASRPSKPLPRFPSS